MADRHRRMDHTGELMRLMKLFRINWPRREKKLPEHEPMRCPTPLFVYGEDLGREPHKLTKLVQKYELMDSVADEK